MFPGGVESSRPAGASHLECLMEYLGYLVFAVVAIFIFLYNSVAMKNRQLELIHARILAILRRRREIAEQAGVSRPEGELPDSTAGWLKLDAALETLFQEHSAEMPEERVREFRELAPLLRQQLELYRKELPAYNAAAGTAFFSFFRFKPREQF